MLRSDIIRPQWEPQYGQKTHYMPRLGPTLKMSGPLTGSSGPRLAPWPDNGIVGTRIANSGADVIVVATDGTDDGATNPSCIYRTRWSYLKGL